MVIKWFFKIPYNVRVAAFFSLVAAGLSLEKNLWGGGGGDGIPPCTSES